MRDQDQQTDYYQILGVYPKASTDEIRRAYRRLSAEWHPVVNSSPEAATMMRLIDEAWDVLGDDEKRTEYDRTSKDRKGSEIPWRTESEDEEVNCWNLAKAFFWIFIVGPLILWVVVSGYSPRRMIDDVEALGRWLNPQPQSTPIASHQTPPGFVGFGPKSGTFDHDTEAIFYVDSKTNVRDFLATVRITNPETRAGGYWMRGLIVRANISESAIAGDLLVIDSDGTWMVVDYDGTDFEPVARGSSTVINTNPGKENYIRVDANGARGLLSINGEAVAEFDFPDPTRSGSIIVFSAAEIGASSASFSGFTIRGFSNTD